MSRRAPAARGKADRNHRAIAEAIELLGYPVMDLSAAGGGIEDLLVGLRRHIGVDLPDDERSWLLVECKVARNRRGEVTESQYTQRQREWREQTAGWPRITATSAQDAVDQIRRIVR